MDAASISFETATEELIAQWWGLWRVDARATPFQSPAWLLPWARQFGGEHCGIVVVRRGGRVSALLPVFNYEGRWLLWGAGTSDWLDGIYTPDLDLSALAAAIGTLDGPLDLFQLPQASPLLHVPVPSGWSEQRRSSEPCVAVDLPLEASRNLRQNLAYYQRRAERAGVSPPERLHPGAFADLVSLHTRRWTSTGETGVLADPRVLAWHQEALPLLEQEKLLRFYGMRLDGRLVATLYALHAKNRAYYYIGGFDPELSSLGLGTILVGHAIAEAEREGAAVFDFLRGQEAYKYRWGATDRPSYARMLAPAAAS